MRRWRQLNQAYAWVMGYFWLRCPLCCQWFGGHEIGDVSVAIGDGSRRICCWRHVGDEGKPAE